MKKLKIQLMSQIPGDFHEIRKAHMHFVPYYLENRGHIIDVIKRKQWLYFYLRYLLFRPDIMLVSGLIGFLPILFKKLGLIRKPIIYYWGDYFYEVMGARWGPEKCAFVEFFNAKNASFVTTPSKFLKKISDILNIKAVYIPHGIVEELEDIKIAELNELGKNQRKVLKFICIGDIAKYKQTDKIIEGVRGKNCILYLIGKVFDKEIIKNLPNNVLYIKEMPHKEVLSYVKACDIAVITADQDSALKMFEYISLKKPILAFNGRINYVLTHKENSYLTEDFKKGVQYLISNPSVLNNLKSNIANFKVKRWSEIAEEYERLMISILKKN